MGIKILLADDSVTAQNMGKKILAEAGHDVVTVSNGAAAAKKIAEASPDLVLLDVFMPGYTGLELCEKLRNATATARMPVLLTVGRMEPYSPQDGARVKADGVIVKPFEASDLIAAVDRLAQKIKGGQLPSHEGDSTAQIPPPTQKEARPVQKEHERTQLMDAGQIAAMLKQAAPAPATPVQASAATAPAAIQEFHVAPPAHSEEPTSTETATPAFSEDLPSSAYEPKTGPVPSYLAQYLVEHAPPKTEGLPPEPPPTAEIPRYSNLEEAIAFAPTLPKEQKKPSWARNAAEAADESSFRNRLSGEAMLEHFREHAVPEPPVASAEGLELTSAAPVPDILIAPAPGFETTSQAADAPTFVMRDPALANELEATTEFPTKFGTDAPETEFPEVSAPPSAPSDEFEARLNAAMSSYDDPAAEPVGEITAPGAETSVEPIQGVPTDSAESFLARVEAAMHVTDSAIDALPEITLAENLISPTETTTEFAPLPLPTIPEHPVGEAELPSLHAMEAPQFGAGPELVLDEAQSVPELQPPFSHSAGESAIVEALHTEAVSHSAITPADLEHEAFHEPDEAVIRQMREAMAFHPDSIHVGEESAEPMAMAAAAAATTPVAPVPTRHEPELEVARGTADVIEIKPPASSMHVSDPEEPAAPAADANRLAAVVERVMKRELPGLIWKIMAELDLKKRD